MADRGLAPGAVGDPHPLPAHRAVEHVLLRVRGHEFEFVGYRTCDPSRGYARVQLLLDTGFSVLDVAVDMAEERRISGSAFEAIPGLTELAIHDLRRVWGGRSVFSWRGDTGIPAGGSFQRGNSPMFVSDGAATHPAYPVLWSCVALTPAPDDPKDRHLRVTLLDPKLVPEATIEYADIGDDGVPREVRLVDLRDGHTLDIEVVEVALASDAPPSAAPK